MSAPRLSSACRAAALIAAMLAAVPAAAQDEITYLLPAPASLPAFRNNWSSLMKESLTK